MNNYWLDPFFQFILVMLVFSLLALYYLNEKEGKNMPTLGDEMAREEEEAEAAEKLEKATKAIKTMSKEILKMTSRCDCSAVLGDAERIIFLVKEALDNSPERIIVSDWDKVLTVISNISDLVVDLEDLKWEFDNVQDDIEAMLD